MKDWNVELTCECEYETHGFAASDRDCHAYADLFPLPSLVAAKTDFGTFQVCHACLADHIGDYALSVSPIKI